MSRYKAATSPPTVEDIQKFGASLRAGATLETAANKAGYRFQALREVLKRGRAGETGYDTFVQVYEDITAEQSDKVWSAIMDRVNEGDPAAIKYFHQHRLAGREKEIEKALLNDEIPQATDPKARSREVTVDLDRLEARATAAARAAAAANTGHDGTH